VINSVSKTNTNAVVQTTVDNDDDNDDDRSTDMPDQNDDSMHSTDLSNLFKVLNGKGSRVRRMKRRRRGKGTTTQNGNIIGNGGIGSSGKGKGGDLIVVNRRMNGRGNGNRNKLHCIYHDTTPPSPQRGETRTNEYTRKRMLKKKSRKGSSKGSKGSYEALRWGKGKGSGYSKGKGKGKGFVLPSQMYDDDFTVLNLNQLGNFAALFKNKGKGSKMTRTCRPIDPGTDQPSARPSIQPSAQVKTGRPFRPVQVITKSPVRPVQQPVGRPVSQSPTVDPGQDLNIPIYFISMVSPGATRGPTKAEYEQMLDIITTYFTQFFVEYFKDNKDATFLRVENQMLNNAFEFGFPEPRYNIYMDFKTVIVLGKDSILPKRAEIFEVMRASINDNFILNWVRTATGTPFENVNEVYFAQVPDDLELP
jgi:hypothetical protein